MLFQTAFEECDSKGTFHCNAVHREEGLAKCKKNMEVMCKATRLIQFAGFSIEPSNILLSAWNLQQLLFSKRHAR